MVKKKDKRINNLEKKQRNSMTVVESYKGKNAKEMRDLKKSKLGKTEKGDWNERGPLREQR